MGRQELGQLSLRLLEAMREQCELRERRRRSTSELLVEQVAQLIAIAGNSSFAGYDPPLRREMFLPPAWDYRYGDDGQEHSTAGMEAVMDRAMAYQAAQVARQM